MIFWCLQRRIYDILWKKIILEYFRMNLQFPDKAGFTLRYNRLVRAMHLSLIRDSLFLMAEFSFLHFKSEAIFSLHHHTNIIDR